MIQSKGLMRPRKRDPAFLRMAALAGAGGVSAIAFSIGMPLWARATGHPYSPVFSLFAAWGFAAVCGAVACIRTYLLSDRTPPPPPRGGVRLAAIDGGRSTEERGTRVTDRAA